MENLIRSQTFYRQGKLVLSRFLKAFFILVFSSVAFIPLKHRRWDPEAQKEWYSTVGAVTETEYLLVRSVKLATVITAPFELKEHSYITSQYVVGDGHFLKGRVPANCPLLHYGSVSGKVNAMKHGCVLKPISLQTVWLRKFEISIKICKITLVTVSHT